MGRNKRKARLESAHPRNAPVAQARGKLASRGGLSLAETLLSCLILVLSSSVLIQTLALAGDHFNTRTRESNARILCNILSQSVQEYLSCATDWTVNSEGFVTDFTTGAIPSFEDPVPCSLKITTEGFLALDYVSPGNKGDSDTGDPNTHLLLAPPSDYSMQSGRPTLEVMSCAVIYDNENGVFNVSIRVAPNQLGPQWDEAMQEVQNNFVVFPVSKSPDTGA